MKKAIFITAIVMSSLTIKAQDTKSKLRLHALNIGLGFFYIEKNNIEGGGADFLIDATFSLDKNLLSASYLTGADLAILGNSEYKFGEISLLYGREWKAADWFSLEGFAGLGYYHQQTEYTDNDIANIPRGKSVSIPLRLNTKFYFDKKFGMGFNTNYSINSVNNNFSFNLIVHYKFD